MRSVLLALAALAVAVPAQAGEERAPLYYVLDQRVWRVEADGTGAKPLPIQYGTASGLSVAPRTHRIAFVDASVNPAIVVVASDDKVTARVAMPKDLDARVAALRWSPTEDRLALSSEGSEVNGVGTGSVYVLDLTKSAFEALGSKGAHDMEPSWSPDGKAVVVASVVRQWDERTLPDLIEQHWESAIEIVDLKTGARRRLVPPSSRLGLPAWSPDGRFIAYASITDVYVVPVASGEPRSVIRGNVNQGPLWSPDGKRLLVVFAQPNLEDPSKVGEVTSEVITMDPDGARRRSFTVPDDVWSLAFGPDGSELALVLDLDRVVRVKADGGGMTVLAKRPEVTSGRLPILTEVAWFPAW